MIRPSFTLHEFGWIVQALEYWLDHNQGLDPDTVAFYHRLRNQLSIQTDKERYRQEAQKLRKTVLEGDAEQLASLRAEIQRQNLNQT